LAQQVTAKERFHYRTNNYFPTIKLRQYFVCRYRGRKIKKNIIRIKAEGKIETEAKGL
jgi:hypothetical protein